MFNVCLRIHWFYGSVYVVFILKRTQIVDTCTLIHFQCPKKKHLHQHRIQIQKKTHLANIKYIWNEHHMNANFKEHLFCWPILFNACRDEKKHTNDKNVFKFSNLAKLSYVAVYCIVTFAHWTFFFIMRSWNKNKHNKEINSYLVFTYFDRALTQIIV